MNHDPEVVEQGGNSSTDDDCSIFYTEHLRHDEGGGAHDRRQQLTAHTRRGFDRSGELLGVAALLHQRNRESTGGYHVGHCTAVDRTEQTAGDDRNLGGATFGGAGEGEGEVVEEAPHSAFVHNRTEEDEEEDIGSGDIDAGSVDSFGVDEGVVDDRPPIVSPVHEDSRKASADEPVQDEDQGKDHQRPPADSSGCLKNENNEHRTEDHIDEVRRAHPVDEPDVIDPYIHRHSD